MLEEQIIPQIREAYGRQVEAVWWMQDGAPCHRRLPVSNVLRETFIIASLDSDMKENGHRSPDLTTCDFFL